MSGTRTMVNGWILRRGRRSWLLCAGALVLGLPGCGDNLEGAADASGPDYDAAAPQIDAQAEIDGGLGDGIAPTVDVIFPPEVSLGTAFQLTVRGTAADADGVAAIRVNGVAATTSNDFADWQALVPLSFGDNTIVVESEDIAGATDASAAELLHKVSPAPLDTVEDMALDAAGGRILALGRVARQTRITAIDIATGERTSLASEFLGSGPMPDYPRAIAWDPLRNRVLLGDSNDNAVYAVDLTTGDRSILSDDNTGTGQVFQTPTALDYDVTNDRVLVGEATYDVLIAVDPVTGDRTILSGAGVGQGPPLVGFGAMVWDGPRNRVLVAPTGVDMIISVDPTTGDRLTLASDVIGSGPIFGVPEALMVDAGGQTAFVVDRELDAVIGVDLATGNRTVLSDANIGSGPALAEPSGAVLDPAGTRVLVYERTDDVVLGVDLAAGTRAFHSTFFVGTQALGLRRPTTVAWNIADDRFYISEFEVELPNDEITYIAEIDRPNQTYAILSDDSDGDRLVDPYEMAYEEGQIYVIDAERGTLSAVDTTTGNRVLLSGRGVGAGEDFSWPVSQALDLAAGRIFVADNDLPGVISVNVATGERTILASEEVGTGPIADSERIVYDAEGDRIFMASLFRDQVLVMDVTTGSRTVLSDSGGIALTRPMDMVLDAARDRLLLTSRDVGLFAVDLQTGARTLLVDHDTGNGPYPGYLSLAMDGDRDLLAGIGDQAIQILDLSSGDRVVVAR